MATEILRAYGWESGNEMGVSHGLASSVSGSTAYTGTYSWRLFHYSGIAELHYFEVDVPGTPADPSVSLWIYLDDLWTSSNNYLRFYLNSGLTVDLRWDSGNKTYDAYVNGSKVADGTVFVPSNNWFHVQFYMVLDDSPNGEINVKINGHESIAYTGDTKPGSETSVTKFRVRISTGTNTYQSFYDDLVIGSGGYLGDLRCIDIRPSADTAVDDWTPSSGDNYSTIDETPASDADYNESSVDGDADELDMTDFDGATYIPVAVTAWVRARQDAGVGDSIKVGVDSNGADDVSAAQALSNSWEYFFHTLDDNPDDAAEWEDADIDALKLRYESVIP